MLRTTYLCAVLVAVASTNVTVAPGDQYAGLPSCRHDARATEADRARRAQALALAKAINTAEADAVRRNREYQPLSALPVLPPVPPGFSLKLFTDGDGYMFAMKDTLDPCRYALFSDNAGLLYEKSARTAPTVAQR